LSPWLGESLYSAPLFNSSQATPFYDAPREARGLPGDAVPKGVRDAVPNEVRDASLSLGTTKNGGSAGHGWRGHPEHYFVAPSASEGSLGTYAPRAKPGVILGFFNQPLQV
jgi:hypothetical protein